jgi:hypothetical protein
MQQSHQKTDCDPCFHDDPFQRRKMTLHIADAAQFPDKVQSSPVSFSAPTDQVHDISVSQVPNAIAAPVNGST